MTKPNHSSVLSLLVLNQAAILVLAVALVLVAPLRTTVAVTAFKFLFYVECGALVYRAVRTGRGSQSPESMMDDLQRGRGALTTPFERWSFVAAVVAIVVLAFS